MVPVHLVSPLKATLEGLPMAGPKVVAVVQEAQAVLPPVEQLVVPVVPVEPSGVTPMAAVGVAVTTTPRPQPMPVVPEEAETALEVQLRQLQARQTPVAVAAAPATTLPRERTVAQESLWFATRSDQ